jgi:hypothetical protein
MSGTMGGSRERPTLGRMGSGVPGSNPRVPSIRPHRKVAALTWTRGVSPLGAPLLFGVPRLDARVGRDRSGVFMMEDAAALSIR